MQAAVVGGGPAGLVAALLLARAGLATRCFAPPPRRADVRTSALMRGSVELLRHLGIWAQLRENAAALRVMRLVDDTGHVVRAPTVEFDCAEIGGGPFAYNLENRHLTTALMELAGATEGLILDPSAVAEIRPGNADAEIVTASGEIFRAALLVGADGHNSLTRRAAGIEMRENSYPQTALAFNIAHGLEHEGISTEFHRAGGPLVLVPLPGRNASVVWVEAPHEAARLMQLDDAALADRLDEATYGLLGDIASVGSRAAFPLTNAVADPVARGPVVLVGEAAHVVPPIGAQGLNLGLRDAAVLAEIVGDRIAAGGSAGDADIRENYIAQRAGDIGERRLAIDLMNRSLLTGFVPLQAARSAGLYALSRSPRLRRTMMRYGMQPLNGLPRIMRGKAN